MVTSVPWQLALAATKDLARLDRVADAGRRPAARGPAATGAAAGPRPRRRADRRSGTTTATWSRATCVELTVGRRSPTAGTAWPATASRARSCSSGTRCRASGSRREITEQRKGYLRADAVEVLRAVARPGDAALPVGRARPLRRLRPAARRAGRAARAGRPPSCASSCARLGGLSADEVDALGVRVERAARRRPARLAHPGAVRGGRRRPGRPAQAPLARGGAGRPVPDRPPGDPGGRRSTGAGVLGRSGRARRRRGGRARPPATSPCWAGAAGADRSRPRADRGDRARRWAVSGAAGRGVLAGAPGRRRHAGRGRAGAARSRGRASGPGTSTAAPACSPPRSPPHLDGTGRVTVVESRPAAARPRAGEPGRPDHGRRWSQSDVERALAQPAAGGSVDLVVLDPPRTGAGAAVVEAIVARRPAGGRLRGLRPGRAGPGRADVPGRRVAAGRAAGIRLLPDDPPRRVRGPAHARALSADVQVVNVA